ncbi:FHA domain-containing protein [Streptomyces sp. NPDC000345]|uniref:FHA domain-containing protein n=1 Tax=Streptomyces sp. NPDC000345 TaxID=3364537 RepID=UPI003691AE91
MTEGPRRHVDKSLADLDDLPVIDDMDEDPVPPPYDGSYYDGLAYDGPGDDGPGDDGPGDDGPGDGGPGDGGPGDGGPAYVGPPCVGRGHDDPDDLDDDLDDSDNEGDDDDSRPDPPPYPGPPPSHPCWSCGAAVAPGSPACPECQESTRHLRLIGPGSSIDLRHGEGPPLRLGRHPVWATAVAAALAGDKGKGVSRRHAELQLAPDGAMWLTEYADGTLNGTYVNDVRIDRGARVALSDGDVIGLGRNCAFKVLLVEPDA